MAILATVAGTAAVMLSGAQTQASTDIARAEMAEIKKAVLRFKADTGFLPKQGPFALVPPLGTGKVPVEHIPSYVSGTPAEKATWFNSPANLWQLLATDAEGGSLLPTTAAESLLFGAHTPHTATHPLTRWHPARRRGWRGPDLTRSKKGYVAVGGSLQPSGTGDPTQGTLLDSVLGLADPFAAPPFWDEVTQTRTSFLTWWPTTPNGPGASARESAGRPYLLIRLGTPDPLLVGFGANGVYESQSYPNGVGDDLVVHILQ